QRQAGGKTHGAGSRWQENQSGGSRGGRAVASCRLLYSPRRGGTQQPGARPPWGWGGRGAILRIKSERGCGRGCVVHGRPRSSRTCSSTKVSVTPVQGQYSDRLSGGI